MKKVKVLSVISLILMLFTTQILNIPMLAFTNVSYADEVEGLRGSENSASATSSGSSIDTTHVNTTDSVISTESDIVTPSSLEMQVLPAPEDVQDIIPATTPVSTEYKKDKSTGKFIVKYKNENAREALSKDLKGKYKKVKSFKGKNNYDVIMLDAGTNIDQFVSEINKKKVKQEIEYIQPDYLVTLSPQAISDEKDEQEVTNENSFNNINKSLNWVKKYSNNVRDEISEESQIDLGIDMESAWEVSKGEGIVVAVIDTGVDINHEDIFSNVFVNTNEIPNGLDDDGNGFIDDINGWNFFDDDNMVYSQENPGNEMHGTGIASIIAAAGNGIGIDGVAPLAKIMPLKVFSEGNAYTSDIIEAISYAERNGARIINCSWGSTEYNQALEDAIRDSCMLFVCAVGNSATNLDVSPVYPASYSLDNIITVGSINENGMLSSFSNYGEISVDVTAPGNDIKCAAPGNVYVQSNGTSISTAYVSGECALVLDMVKDSNAVGLKRRVIETCDRLSTLIGKVFNGNKINCYNAVTGRVNEEIIQVRVGSGIIGIYDYEELNSEQQDGGYELYASGGSWTTLANMLTPKVGAGAALANGKILVTGGYNSSSGMLTTVEEYNPASNSWTAKTPLSISRYYHSSESINNMVYIMGGVGSKGYTNTVEEFNPISNIWVSKAPMLSKRYAFPSVVINDKILVFGGYNGSSYINSVEEYDPVTNTWTAKAPMPVAVTNACADVVNGMIYITGGKTSYNTYGIVQQYDPSTNSWTTFSDQILDTSSHASGSINGKIYIIGGMGETYRPYIQEYDPATQSFTMKKRMTTSRYSMASIELNGEIYIMGGYYSGYKNTVEKYKPETDIPPAPGNITLYSEMDKVTLKWEPAVDAASYEVEIDGSIVNAGSLTSYVSSGFSPDTQHKFRVRSKNTVGTGSWSAFYYKNTKRANADFWVTKARSNEKRTNFGTASVNGKIYVIGGNTVATSIYDVATDSWSYGADMPTKRVFLGVAELNGKIYAIGGHVSGNINKVEVYDTSTNTWQMKANMPTARNGFAIEVVNGKIYVIGGMASTFSNLVEEYDPVSDTWTTKASMPTARDDVDSTVIDGKIYVMGGDNGSGVLDNVEMYDPTTNTWSTKASMPARRNVYAAAAADGMIYVIGGYYSNVIYSTVYMYNPITNVWSTKSNMPTNRRGCSAETVNGKIYVIAGADSFYGVNNVVEEYTPGADSEAPSTPQSLNSLIQSSNSIDLMWSSSADNTGIAGYDIYKRDLTPTGENLISNGGFEDGVTGWTWEVNGGNEAAFCADITEKFSGNNSAKIDITKVGTTLSTSNIQFKKVGAPITAGKRYLIRLKAKADKPRMTELWIGKNVSPYSSLGSLNKTYVDITNEWKSYSLIFTASYTDLTTSRLSIRPLCSLGTVWLDDIEMYELTTSETATTYTVPSGTSYRVNGLLADRFYEFTMKGKDYEGNVSPVSNSFRVCTLPSRVQIIEVESMTLLSYTKEYNSNASGVYQARLPSGTGRTSFVYSGSSGRKNMTVWYFDEPDGQSKFSLFINGIEKNVWMANLTLPDTTPTRNNRIGIQLKDIFIDQGDEIIIEGTMNGGEFACLDNVEITGCDPEKPTAPKNLAIKALTDNAATLKWDASMDNDGIVGYDIYNGSALVGSVANVLEYTVNGLDQGMLYEFYIKAKDAEGNMSEKSNALFISNIIVDNTDSGFSTDSPWSASTYSPGYYGINYFHDGTAEANPASRWAKWVPNITKTGSYDLYMRWTAAPGRPDAAPIEIAYAGGIDTNKTVNQTTNDSTWVYIGEYAFTAGMNAYVKILATDVGSTIADAVKLVLSSSSDTTAPTAPGNLLLVSRTDTVINIKWSSSTDNVGVAGYEVYNGTELIGTTNGTTSFSAIGLLPNTIYSLTVKAKDEEGNLSAASNVLSVQTNKSIKDLTALKAVITGNSIIVTWNTVEGATGYDIEVDGVVFNNGISTSYTHSGLLPSTRHSYRIKIRSIDGDSEWSELITCSINNMEYIINCVANKEYIIMLDCNNISDFNNLTLNLDYNASEIEVTDLSAFTKQRELSVGAITGTDVQIIAFIPGHIKYKINKSISPGSTWSGVANTIRIKCKNDGRSKISYSINKE